MKERRKYQRYDANIDVKLRFQDLDIPCRTRNLSEGGSLLLVDRAFGNALTQTCIGEKASFQLYSVQTPATIVRSFESGAMRLVALSYQGH